MRKEDQDKINRFSRLHSREKGLEEELKVKQVCDCVCGYDGGLCFFPFTCASSTWSNRARKRQKDKEDLEEISSELELADEEEKVPYVHLRFSSMLTHPRTHFLWILTPNFRYKIGDSFFNLPVPEVQELLSAAVERIDREVSTVEEKLGEYREEMQTLKSELYGRFGKSINLEV